MTETKSRNIVGRQAQRMLKHVFWDNLIGQTQFLSSLQSVKSAFSPISKIISSLPRRAAAYPTHHMRHAHYCSAARGIRKSIPETGRGAKELNRQKQLCQSVSQADWLLSEAYLTAIPLSLALPAGGGSRLQLGCVTSPWKRLPEKITLGRKEEQAVVPQGLQGLESWNITPTTLLGHMILVGI